MGMLEKMKNYMSNNDEKEQKKNNKFTEMLKKVVKKIAKELLKFVIAHLWILIPIFIALIVIVVIFLGLTNKSVESSAKAGAVITEKSRFENGEIVIDEDLYDEIRNSLRNSGVNPDSIYLGKNYPYLEKMVQATIVTNYVDTGKGDIRGRVKVYRQKSDGNPRIALTYVDEATFNSMLEGNSSDSSVSNLMNYFTLDASMNIIIAKYNKTTTKDINGNVTNEEYHIDKVTLSYIDKVSQYSMPFEFLYVLLITTLNPEYVEAVADLAISQTEIDFTIMDSKYINRTETEHTYWTETTEIVNGAEGAASDVQSREHTTLVEEINNITAEITHVKTWIYTKELSYETTDYPEEKVGEGTVTGPEDPPNPDNPGNPDYADQEPTYGPERMVKIIVDEPQPDGTVKQVEKEVKAVTKTRIHDIQDYIEEYSQRTVCIPGPNAEKDIDCDLFLGLWSNETGKYEEGALYVRYQEGGEVVIYKVPDTGLWNSPAVTICEYPTLFFYQLGATEKTQNYENLMRYVLYVYTGIDFGITEEDLTYLLDMFSKYDFRSPGGGAFGEISLTTPVLSREDFIKALNDYSSKLSGDTKTSFDTHFRDHAGEIYDWGVQYGVNPELIVTKAKGESNFKQPNSGNYNFWGIRTPNGQKAAGQINSMQDGVKEFGEKYVAPYSNPGNWQYNAILQKAEDRAQADCNPNGYGPPGTLKGFLSLYQDLCGSDTKHREGNWGSGGNIYLKVIYGNEFNAKCGSIHKIGVDDYTIQEKADYTAWVYEQQLSVWSDIFGAYGSLGGIGDSDIPSNILSASKQEKLMYLFDNKIPTSSSGVGSYIGAVEVDMTKKDGTKFKGTLYIHKALHKDVQEIFKLAQDSGFVIYEAGGLRGWEILSGGSVSQHSYGIAIDINVRENYMPGVAGEFWDPAKSEYSIPRDGTLVKAFKAKGWGWGGDWNSKKDYMHFSFTGY